MCMWERKSELRRNYFFDMHNIQCKHFSIIPKWNCRMISSSSISPAYKLYIKILTMTRIYHVRIIMMNMNYLIVLCNNKLINLTLGRQFFGYMAALELKILVFFSPIFHFNPSLPFSFFCFALLFLSSLLW